MRAVDAAVVGAFAGAPGVTVLAVSGGLDSMVLLDAAARLPEAARRFVVATFDHGTGPWATEAVAFVRREARARGLPVTSGRVRRATDGESAWRRARWDFLHHVARRRGASAVATAHSRDDQVETVLMRVLRGAGARGLAGLAAPSPVRRPLVALTRAQLAAYAEARGLDWREDPSNASSRFLRNRVRHELLPALRAVRPGFDEELLALGARAAAWRVEMERVVDAIGLAREPDGSWSVASASLKGYSRTELAVLWPALAARAGLRLDRRGTSRLAEVTMARAKIGRIPLAGGGDVVCLRDRFVLRRHVARPFAARALHGEVRVDGWRFRPAPADAMPEAGDWMAHLPPGQELIVRSWQPGDRIRSAGRPTARRVKRFLAEAGIPGPLRAGWPVIVAGREVLWIPGVCRSDAATARPGRPAVPYLCERCHR
ncbi:MAG TPA: tRNA lysidine(34) synthetase TilS [Gemmatimonadaceae bacterium]|nr:tRNA lysidine(34) synthetase TilS [Gemmatimonadaceae bacterium]